MGHLRKIILVRHGESEGNIDKHVYANVPDWKINLTQKGRDQAEEVGKKLVPLVDDHNYLEIYNKAKNSIRVLYPTNPKVMVYYSPFYRAEQTKNIAVSQWPDWIEKTEYCDPRLREQEWGHLRTVEQTAKDEAERDFYGLFFFRFDRGESGADSYDRASLFLDTLWRDVNADKMDYAVIFSHGLFIRVFCMRWFHLSVAEFEKLRNPPNGAIIVIERNIDGKFVLKTPFGVYEKPAHKEEETIPTLLK